MDFLLETLKTIDYEITPLTYPALEPPFFSICIYTLLPFSPTDIKSKAPLFYHISTKMDTSLFPIAIGLLLAVLSYFLLNRLRYKLPPGPRPWPVVGNLYDIKPVRFRCFAEWAEKYGPIMSVWFGTSLTVVVTTTELAKEVLKEHDQQLADRPRNRSTARFSRGGMDLIWADYGPHYVKVRKVCNLELFSPKRLELLRPIREDEVTAMVESIFRSCTQPGMLTSRSFYLCLYFVILL